LFSFNWGQGKVVNKGSADESYRSLNLMIKKILIIVTLLVSTISSADELLYLSSGGALDVKKIDLKTGKLTDLQKVELQGMTVFTFSRNKKFLYIKARIDGDKEKPSIATYQIASDGLLSFVFNAPIDGNTTELKTDHTDHFLAGANYQEGTASIWKLEKGIYKGELVQRIVLEKQSHAARFSPDNKMLFIPATGPNKIFQLVFNQQTGSVKMKAPAIGPKTGAAQPRHLVFHKTLDVAYTTLERIKPGVAAWRWDPVNGELELMQSLINSDDVSGRITNADLHISPDQEFLYISSRDQEQLLDQIIAYKINPVDGTLTLVKKFASEHFPRSFGINKTGDFIYVAGQKANKLGVYKINKSKRVVILSGSRLWSLK
jgi:6-phosphogluconolactonase